MMPTSDVFDEVVVCCPACGYRWLAAYINVTAWWACQPEQIAMQCVCPTCEQAPPMRLVGVPIQLALPEDVAPAADARGDMRNH
jgi:hypothetical protein